MSSRYGLGFRVKFYIKKGPGAPSLIGASGVLQESCKKLYWVPEGSYQSSWAVRL